MRKILLTISLLMPLMLFAQSGTNSPYSQFGVGVLAEQGTGFTRGMNGLGVGLYDSKQVNYLNPASYSSIDSLTFIFDVGASLQLTNFKEGNTKKNARNGNFEYAVASFRVMKNFGMAVGIIPFSNIGYNYSKTEYIDEKAKTTTNTATYYGSGGLRTIFLGAGYSPLKGLRIGANIGILWGSYARVVSETYSDSYINTLTRTYDADLASYKLDLGVQYTYKFGNSDYATIGVTYSPGHSLNGDATMSVLSTNSQTSVTSGDTTSIAKGIFIPTQFGIGLSYNHGSRIRVGLDYTLQKWSSKPFPAVTNMTERDAKKIKYAAVNGVLMDRHRFTLGGEYVNNPAGHRYLDHVHIRAGVSYATPYIKVNGQNGPKEISASLGLGLPIINGYNNRSTVNISAQYCHNAATGLITENIFRINIGLTFNERWFMKWKLE